ncbi:Neurotrypsin, partial [Tetrabaena socialis]
MAARVACAQMGMSGGLAICCNARFSTSTPIPLILLDDVTCSGTETRLTQCRNQGWGVHDCDAGDLRLVGGHTEFEGRIEVFYEGSFGAVCDDRFTDAAARVACAQLGMAGGVAICCDFFTSTGSHPPILLDEVTCYGNETSLVQCGSNGWRQHDCEPQEAWQAPAIRRGYARHIGISGLANNSGTSFDVSVGDFIPAGPSVAGWRWKHGSTGATTGYSPSTSPELTAAQGHGINATYQLVYELRYGERYEEVGGYQSYPSLSRFAVFHPRSTAPLFLYVKLASATHRADMIALLLQRVEGDSVWTIASFAAGSNEIVSGQTDFIVRDTTSRATWAMAKCIAASPASHKCPSTSQFDDVSPQPADNDTTVATQPAATIPTATTTTSVPCCTSMPTDTERSASEWDA